MVVDIAGWNLSNNNASSSQRPTHFQQVPSQDQTSQEGSAGEVGRELGPTPRKCWGLT